MRGAAWQGGPRKELNMLPAEVLALVEEAVDKLCRTHKPAADVVFRRVRWRCRRDGWALNATEEQQLHAVTYTYVANLRSRPRVRRLVI
jgi:hypothetical protein